jgi:hypothetical protein
MDEIKFKKRIGLITIIILSFISFFLIFSILRVGKRYYSIYVKFKFVGDLRKGADVKYLGGAIVGYVKDIYKSGDWIEVHLKIDKNFKIKNSYEFNIFTVGMVGARYIEIMPASFLTNKNEFFLPANSVVWGNDAMGLEVIQYNLAKFNIGLSKSEKDIKPLDVMLKNSVKSIYNIKTEIIKNRVFFQQNLNMANSFAIKILTGISNMKPQLDKYSRIISQFDEKKINSYLKKISTFRYVVLDLNKSTIEFTKVIKNLGQNTDKVRSKENNIGKLIYDDTTYKELLNSTEKILDISEKLAK